MPRRLTPPAAPVVLTLDGERVVANRGEPVAAALVAAGKWTLARSPKFHRPRGPSCMRGACDGCLARVDGNPNVMTCLTPAEAGLAVVSQNTLGSRELDLLRMTDWFFPDGMNHHELFAGVPGVQSAMQIFARRVAGLGLLPDAPKKVEGPTRAPAQRRRVEVLVVGAGPAGMAAASALADAGRVVEVVDDGAARGGSTRGILETDPVYRSGFDHIVNTFDAAVRAKRVKLWARHVAGGVFGKDVLVVGPRDGGVVAAEVLEPRTLVLATGAHDGILPFENNDLPGVMSARAACFLLASGVLAGERVVLVTGDDEDHRGVRFGEIFARAVGGATIRSVREVVRATGSSGVRGVVVRESTREERLVADLILVDVPRSPAYELALQAGATLERRREGFRPLPVAPSHATISPGVLAIGELTGAPLDARSFMDAARALADEL